MKFGLRNSRLLLHAAGDPHKQIPAIHIAGTNGKGSTGAMAAAILTSAGYNVGLYTSPHLVKFNERIRINGEMISDSAIDRITKKLKPSIKQLNATFFEATTAIAFRYFAEGKVDIAVIETGLGGRLDATNVLRPLVSVITTIGLEHTEYLGTTLAHIAREKAGIIKRKIPVVIGLMNPSASSVIKKIARQREAPLIDSAKLRLPKNVALQLIGDHQKHNARTAVSAVRTLVGRFAIPTLAIKAGLEHTVRLSGLRARFEIIPGLPMIIVDAAHNPDGMEVLVREMIRRNHHSCIVIFGVMKDKNYHQMLRTLKRLDPFIIATQSSVERSLSPSEITASCKDLGIESVGIPDFRKALRAGKRRAGRQGVMLVTGSHYLIGDILPFIEKKA